MRLHCVRNAIDLAVPCCGITGSARVGAAALRILGSFAKESEE